MAKAPLSQAASAARNELSASVGLVRAPSARGRGRGWRAADRRTSPRATGRPPCAESPARRQASAVSMASRASCTAGALALLLQRLGGGERVLRAAPRVDDAASRRAARTAADAGVGGVLERLVGLVDVAEARAWPRRRSACRRPRRARRRSPRAHRCAPRASPPEVEVEARPRRARRHQRRRLADDRVELGERLLAPCRDRAARGRGARARGTTPSCARAPCRARCCARPRSWRS